MYMCRSIWNMDARTELVAMNTVWGISISECGTLQRGENIQKRCVLVWWFSDAFINAFICRLFFFPLCCDRILLLLSFNMRSIYDLFSDWMNANVEQTDIFMSNVILLHKHSHRNEQKYWSFFHARMGLTESTHTNTVGWMDTHNRMMFDISSQSNNGKNNCQQNWMDYTCIYVHLFPWIISQPLNMQYICMWIVGYVDARFGRNRFWPLVMRFSFQSFKFPNEIRDSPLSLYEYRAISSNL